MPQVRARSLGANLGPFWQARYYDRNVRDYREFTVKLRYLHRNPGARFWLAGVKAGEAWTGRQTG